jgi:hypothetical protein
MSQLFSESWMRTLKEKWNAEPKVYEPLGKAGFEARIGYGFEGEDTPRGIISIVGGKIVAAGNYSNEKLDWDLRASPESWKLWLEQGFGLTRLGPAVAMRKLQFVEGNYRQMIRNPALSHPFLYHFDLMTSIRTTY